MSSKSLITESIPFDIDCNENLHQLMPKLPKANVDEWIECRDAKSFPRKSWRKKIKGGTKG